MVGHDLKKSHKKTYDVDAKSLTLCVTDTCNVLDRAKCVIRTIILGDRPTARASLTQVRGAANALSLQCAAGGQSQGGMATNIGQYNRDL